MASAPSYCRWSTRRYTLAALAGILIATIVVIVVSAVLKPAEIHFAVTTSSSSPENGGKRLNLILTANNTSQHAGVQYRNVIVSLQYYTAVPTSSKLIPLDNISAPLCQSPGETTSINVSTFFPRKLWMSDFARKDGTTTPISVLVDTVVRFKYGRAYTRPYDIRVSCGPVDYFNASLPINCSEA